MKGNPPCLHKIPFYRATAAKYRPYEGGPNVRRGSRAVDCVVGGGKDADGWEVIVRDLWSRFGSSLRKMDGRYRRELHAVALGNRQDDSPAERNGVTSVKLVEIRD
jgi:hypothetical protein